MFLSIQGLIKAMMKTSLDLRAQLVLLIYNQNRSLVLVRLVLYCNKQKDKVILLLSYDVSVDVFE